jgi:nucleoporin p58/p45
MFSSLNQPQAQPVQGLPSAHFPGSSFGGGLSVGQNNQQQQQTVPGVKIDTANIRGATRFNDLHEDLQKQIELMDTVIDQQIQMKNQCDAIMPSHDFQLSSIPADVEFCRRKLKGLDTAIIADVQAIAHVKEYISSDLKNATSIFKAVEVLKLPNQYHSAPGLSYKNHQTGDSQSQSNGDTEVQDLVALFSSNANELSAILAKYQKHIGEIEQHLRSVEESSAQQVNALIARRNGGTVGDEDNVRQLAEALTEFEQSIFHVAGKVGGIKEGILRLGGTPFGTVNGRSTNGHRTGVY